MKEPALKPLGNTLAYQHNHLIRAPVRMGVIESRIFIQALSAVSMDTTAFTSCIIPVAMVMRELENGDDYAAIKRACDALVSRILDLVPANQANARTHKVPLMAEVETVKGTGTIRVSFNDKAKPYLLQLKESGNFTSAEVATLLSFRNPNSARLYWILKSWSGLGRGTVHVKEETLDNLKFWLLADKQLYPLFTEFKRRVLDPVAAEFTAIGYGATWEAVKTGKKTTGLRFTIPRNQERMGKGKPSSRAPAAGQPALANPPPADKYEQLRCRLVSRYGLAPRQVAVVTHYVQANGDEKLKSLRLNNVVSFLGGLDVSKAKTTLGGYVWSCLRAKFPYLGTLESSAGTDSP